MSERDNGDRPATVGDLAVTVAVLFVIMTLISFSDSCQARWRYLDLRDRLERIEQRQR